MIGSELRFELDDQNIDVLDDIIILEYNNHLIFGRINSWFNT